MHVKNILLHLNIDLLKSMATKICFQ